MPQNGTVGSGSNEGVDDPPLWSPGIKGGVGKNDSKNTENDPFVTYTPYYAFVGIDSLQIAVCCGDDCDTSWIHILVASFPDNVIDADCTLPQDSNAFDIVELFSCGSGTVNSMSTPMVADMDGDGLPEIIACKNTSNSPWYSNDLLVFSGQTGALIKTINTSEYVLHGQLITIADIDGDGEAEIFMLDRSGYLHCYNYSGSQRWVNTTVAIGWNYLPTVADLMGDGTPELVCGSYILNAQNGTLLLFGTTQETGRGFGAPRGYNSSLHIPYYLYALADIDNDGTLELCAGNSIYKININNDAGTIGNTFSLLRQAADNASIDNYDGQTFVLDFDGDGDLDVCVVGTTHEIANASSPATAHTIYPYVWDGQTSEIIAYSSLSVNSNMGTSIPFGGDLDGDGLPEMVFSVSGVGMQAYAYDATQPGNMRLKHSYAPFGGATGATLFDFNQDGHDEIVYRGTDKLFIVDDITLDTLCAPITSYSGTIAEYPVVADVTGDGHAEIVVASAPAPWNLSNPQGSIRVFGSATPGAWSSARKVWNQWAYNSVNINEDMTVPQYQFDPATRFPNGKQPFNGFLKQMPYLDRNGNLHNPAADVASNTASALFTADGDSITVTLNYCNQGDNHLQAPYGIAVYQNSYRGTLLWVDTVSSQLGVDSCETRSFRMPLALLCSLRQSDSIIVALNDLGIGIAQHGQQPTECDTTNNIIKIATPAYHNVGDTSAVSCNSFTWFEHVEITESTEMLTHTFVGGNAAGCDSTVTLHLTVNYSTTGDTTAVSCNSFSWYGHTEITESTEMLTHTFVGGNAAGCDSTVTLHLTINHCSTTDTLARDSITIGGTTITSDTVVVIGHDTIVVTVCHTVREQIDTAACNLFVWNGQTYTESTTLIDTVAKPDGCDSITTLNLTVNHCSTTTLTVCDSLTWHGTLYTSSGLYADGNDTLNLTVNYSTTGDTSAVSCNSFSWYGHTEITESTEMLTHTFVGGNAAGCDSTVTLHLTINHCSTTDTLARDSITIGGTTITSDTVVVIGHDTIIVTVCHTVRELIDTAACNLFVWNGQTYTESTTVIDTVAKPDGCDSITTLNLTVNHCSTTDTLARDSITIGGTTITSDTVVVIGHDTIVVTVCHTVREVIDTAACNQFVWNGQTYTESTTVIDTVAKPDGCDSITTLNLTINHCSTTDTLARDSITIGGTTITSDTVVVIGHDTIIVTVCHTVREVIDTDACNLFVWNGQTYTESTTVTDTVAKPDGCDSITTLNLTINHCSTTTLTVCDSLTWHGTLYTSSGLYADGNDTLNLTVNYSTTGDTSAVSCNSFSWYGHTEITESTEMLTHTFVGGNAAGCDSTVTLHLTINHCSTTDTIARDSIVIDGTTITSDTVVVIGHDTIVVTVCHTVRELIDTAACNMFVWNGQTYTESTTVTDTVAKPDGCDSITTLNLTVNHCSTTDTIARDSITIGGTTITSDTVVVIGHDTIVVTVCHTVRELIDTAACNLFVWNGQTYTESTTLIDTVAKPDGCDSITTLNLTINHCSTTTLTVCDSLIWHGTLYTTSGLYVDGIDTLDLTVNYSTTGDTSAVSCNSFSWYGHTEITESTEMLTHTFVGGNAAGCDSTVTLHLTINHCSTTDTLARDSITIGGTTITSDTVVVIGHDTIVVTVCHTVRELIDTAACNLFVWNGQTYTASTTVIDTVAKPDGCDSITTLNLTINNCSTMTLTVCDSLTWHGTLYTSSGLYADGNDTLNLTVHYSNSGDTIAYACDGFDWHDSTLTVSGDYLWPQGGATSTNAAGCDSTTTLHLTVNHTSLGDTTAIVCDSITWYGTNYSVEGDYNHLLTSLLPTHCDSLLTLHLSIKHSVTKETFDSLCAGSTYLFDDEELVAGGIYSHHYPAANGCDSTQQLTLTMLTLPVVSIDQSPDCETGTHILRANSNVDHIRWTSSSGWLDEWGSDQSHILAVNLNSTVTFTLTADYREPSICLNSASVTLNPIVMPQAEMKVSPDFLTNDNMTLSAISQSRNAEWLQWYIDGSDYSSDSRISYTALNDADSVTVTLIAINNPCTDTTERTIHVRRSSIFAPNAFTPDESTNRTFTIFTDGVIEYQLDIYTRQGLHVYTTTTDNLPWDGTHGGQRCPQGSYVWIVRYRSIIDPQNWHIEKGTVTLIR